jgi:hypothetical protein
MRKSLKPHDKFLQALGVTIAIVAWIMDWGSAVKARDRQERFDEQLHELANDHATRNMTDNLHWELALARASPVAGSDNVIELRKGQWESAEVRLAWIQRFAGLRELISRELDLVEEYSGSAESDTSRLEPILRARLDVVRESVSLTGETEDALVPDASSIPPAAAGFALIEARRIQASSDSLVRDVRDKLAAHRTTSAKRQKLVYFFSAFLVAAGQWMGWWANKEKRSSREHDEL